jgi:hypothetical protein
MRSLLVVESLRAVVNPEPESISDDCTKLDHMHQMSLALIIIRIAPALKHLVSA